MEEALIALGLIAAVAVLVSSPFWRRAGETEDPVLADLEARKEVKYRELRDLDLDHAAGKVGREDYDRQRASLRQEAIEILDRIDDHRAPREGDRGTSEEASA